MEAQSQVEAMARIVQEIESHLVELTHQQRALTLERTEV